MFVYLFSPKYGGFLQIVAYTKIGNVAIVGCLLVFATHFW